MVSIRASQQGSHRVWIIDTLTRNETTITRLRPLVSKSLLQVRLGITTLCIYPESHMGLLLSRLRHLRMDTIMICVSF